MVDAEPTYNGKMRVTTPPPPPKGLKRIVPTGNCYFTFSCPLGASVRLPCGGGGGHKSCNLSLSQPFVQWSDKQQSPYEWDGGEGA